MKSGGKRIGGEKWRHGIGVAAAKRKIGGMARLGIMAALAGITRAANCAL
jgi:hypothetical protein